MVNNEVGTMKKRLDKTVLLYGLLLVITCVLLFLPMGSGDFFGTDGDWLSQHVGIAETLKYAILENHSLLPQYLQLGGGSSIYDYAYYGLLRPDVLISCLIPEVETKYVIAGYAVFGVISSVELMFFWLRRKKVATWCAFGSSILFACAACFYHAHYQIMFINYMPFLILALMGVDHIMKNGRSVWLIPALFMIYVHSFYYAIACLFVIGIYALHSMIGKEKKDIKICMGKLVFAVGLSIAMAMVLLFPIGLDILSTSKDGGSFEDKAVQLVDFGMKGLLYSPYGCGMTLIILYCLLVSLRSKKKRFLSASILVCMILPVISLVLNGLLYARAKILIPFTPLLVLLAADTLQDLWEKKEKHSILAFLLTLVPVIASTWKPLVIIDVAMLLLWILLQIREWNKKSIKAVLFGIVFFMPVLVSLSVNASASDLQPLTAKLGVLLNGRYIKAADDRQEHFTKNEIENVVTDGRYRFDITANCFMNSNISMNKNMKRTSMYSSISNTEYSEFYYDTMANAILGNNRVALVPGNNPFFNYFMGVKYVMARKDNLPDSYDIKYEKNEHVLAQNDDVLPVCYGTTAVMSQEDYEKLSFPENLEALCSYAIVEDKNVAEKRNAFSSHFETIDIESVVGEDGKQCLLDLGKKEEEITIPLKQQLCNQILILQFHVNRKDGKEVAITINGTKNKLSAKSAPYPNGNDTFIYMFESVEGLEQLEIIASKGNYQLENVKCYVLSREYVHHGDVIMPEVLESGKAVRAANVYEGSITMEQSGYFVTSFPYRDGYRMMVDDKEVETEIVNTTFIGCAMEPGTHQVQIYFEAPGYKLGLVVSLLAFAVFGIMCLYLELRLLWNRKN